MAMVWPATSITRQPLLFLHAGCFFLSLWIGAPRHVAASAASPFSFSFNFTKPSTYSNNDLRFEGGAGQHGNLVDLTCNSYGDLISNCIGRMSYNQQVPLYDSTGEVASFETRFTFAVKANDAFNKGDGITFFLCSYPSSLPSESYGGNLALHDGEGMNPSSANRFVAVEFDTFNNTWDPKGLDHIGIDINTVRASRNTTSLGGGLLINGSMTASITFNSSTRVLAASLMFDDRPSLGPIQVSYELPDVTSLLPPEVAVGFSASTGGSVELNQILSWSFNSTLSPTHKRKGYVMYGLAGAGGVFLLGLVVWIIVASLIWVHQGKSLVKGASDWAKRFEYRELVDATNNFSDELGSGGFGAVYKGTVTNQDGQQQQVAVKKLDDPMGTDAFLAELKATSEARHKNLVRLTGWCCRRSWSFCRFVFCRQRQNVKLFIVCELVPNRNLEHHLYHTPEHVLAWRTRYSIIIDIGTALHYLHYGCRPYILHRDIKPSNVLLDYDFNAKLADFGLSRIANESNATLHTIAMGSIGYLDPQCKKDGKVKFNRSSDVYSFGIVLLEIASGKNRDKVWDLYTSGAVMEAAASALDGEFEGSEMQRAIVLGLWCSFPDNTKRPNMVQVMQVLEHKAQLPDLNKYI